MPSVVDKRRRRRKISIEVHLVSADDGKVGSGNNLDTTYQECIVRVFDQSGRKERADAIRRAKDKSKSDQSDHSVTDDYPDDTSVSPGFIDLVSTNYATAEFEKGWKLKYRFPLGAFYVKSANKATVTVEIALDRVHEVRNLIFDSVAEAEEFQTVIKRELSLENHRGRDKLSAIVGKSTIFDAKESITFLIEIVSGWNLPIADFLSSDPYVKCVFNGKTIHKTKHVSNTRKFRSLWLK